MIETSTAYKRHRFPARLIAHAVWLYFRFPLSLRLVDELLLERGVMVSYETIRRWAARFGPAIARGVRRRAPRPGGIWHLNEVRLVVRGRVHWLWRAVDQHGIVLDEILQRRRDKRAAKRLLVALLKRQGWAPRHGQSVRRSRLCRRRRASAEGRACALDPSAIQVRSLTQVQAARLMGVSQPDVSRMLRGHFRDFSAERLMRFRTALGCGVDIVVRSPGDPTGRTDTIHLQPAQA